MEDEGRKEILGWLLDDIKELSHKDICKIYRYVRRYIICKHIFPDDPLERKKPKGDIENG